jgi:hypothetical protein
MADTANAYPIPGNLYTDLNALTSIVAGTEVLLQNVGGPNDIIEVATGAAQPAASFTGVRMEQHDFLRIDAGESTIWVKYLRLDRADVGVRTTKIQVQV